MGNNTSPSICSAMYSTYLFIIVVSILIYLKYSQSWSQIPVQPWQMVTLHWLHNHTATPVVNWHAQWQIFPWHDSLLQGSWPRRLHCNQHVKLLLFVGGVEINILLASRGRCINTDRKLISVLYESRGKREGERVIHDSYRGHHSLVV